METFGQEADPVVHVERLLALNAFRRLGIHVLEPGQCAGHPVDKVVAQSLEIPAPGVGPNVGVPTRVLQRAVVGPALISLVWLMESIAVPRIK